MLANRETGEGVPGQPDDEDPAVTCASRGDRMSELVPEYDDDDEDGECDNSGVAGLSKSQLLPMPGGGVGELVHKASSSSASLSAPTSSSFMSASSSAYAAWVNLLMLAIPGDRTMGDDRGLLPSNTGRLGSSGVVGNGSQGMSEEHALRSDELGEHEYENKGRRACFNGDVVSSSSSCTEEPRLRFPAGCRGGVNNDLG